MEIKSFDGMNHLQIHELIYQCEEADETYSGFLEMETKKVKAIFSEISRLQQRVDELESICKHCHGTGSYIVASGNSHITDCEHCKQPDPSAGAGEDDMWVGAIKESRTEESEVCITCEGDKVIPISSGIEIIRYEDCPTCGGKGRVE